MLLISIILVVISIAFSDLPLMVNGDATETKYIPGLLVKSIHYTMTEETQGSNNARSFNEITASDKNLLMRIKTSVLGVKTDKIYDHGLGIVFSVEEGQQCHVAMGDKNSPGKDEAGYFAVENLFYLNYDYDYIGKASLEDRSGLPVIAWESVQFNVAFNGKQVDKLVVTQYFVKSHSDKVFYGHSLVRTIISVYNSDSSRKSYTLAERITRDYTSFQAFESETELKRYFSIKDCKNLISDKKVTLNFKLGCEASSTECIKVAKNRMDEFVEEFKKKIIKYQPITPLRIDDIQYRLTDSVIEFDVTFLDKPDLDVLIKSQQMLVSSESLNKAKTRTASNESECLNQLGRVARGFAVAIYRPSDSFCGYLKQIDDLKEDTNSGQSCNVYIFPLKNFIYIKNELSLDTLHSSFLKDKSRRLSLRVPSKRQLVPFDNIDYKILDIVALK